MDIASKILIFSFGTLIFYFVIRATVHITRGLTTRRQNGKINTVELIKFINYFALSTTMYSLLKMISIKFQFSKSIFNCICVIFILIMFISSVIISFNLSRPDKFKLLSHIKGKWRKVLSIVYSILAFISFYVCIYTMSFVLK